MSSRFMTPNAIVVIITRENDNGATEILLQKNNKLGLIRILINKIHRQKHPHTMPA